jgi:hypothetical protein
MIDKRQLLLAAIEKYEGEKLTLNVLLNGLKTELALMNIQENPNTTAEGVKTGETSRITPKVVPEKVLTQSPDNIQKYICKCGHDRDFHKGLKGTYGCSICNCILFVPQSQIKGCGNNFQFSERTSDIVQCGEPCDLHHGQIHYCDSCKKKLNSPEHKPLVSNNHADGKVHDSSRNNEGYKTPDNQLITARCLTCNRRTTHLAEYIISKDFVRRKIDKRIQEFVAKISRKQSNSLKTRKLYGILEELNKLKEDLGLREVRK